MTPKIAELITRKVKHSVVRIDDTLGFNNYVIVNEETKDYYEVSIAKNTSLTESVGGEIFYTIKKNGTDVIKEDIYGIFPLSIVKTLLNEVEEYVDSDHLDETVDYFTDILYQVGYTPRHVIHYDNIEESLDIEFLIIINGGLDTLYLSVSKGGDVEIVEDMDNRTSIGNIDTPEYIKTGIERHLNDMEHFTAMVSEEDKEEAMKESFRQVYGVYIENGFTKIYEKDNLREAGFVDRKKDIYKLNEDLKMFGKDFITEMVQESEIKQLLSESTEEVEDVETTQGFQAFKEVMVDKPLKVNDPFYKGEIVIRNPKYRMSQWQGRDWPMIDVDIDLLNVKRIILFGYDEEQVFDVEGDTELHNVFQIFSEKINGGVPSSVYGKLSYVIQSWIKNKLKYFGLNLDPKVLNFRFSPKDQ